MTVIHVEFGKQPASPTPGVDEIVQGTRGEIAKELDETGFHKATIERVCNHVSRLLAEQLENINKELVFTVEVKADARSPAPNDVAAAVNKVWQEAVQARMHAVGKAAIAAVTLATFKTVLIMANSDRLR